VKDGKIERISAGSEVALSVGAIHISKEPMQSGIGDANSKGGIASADFSSKKQRILPRWKMALLTWIAVWPASMLSSFILKPALGPNFPHVLAAGLIAAGVVVILTWVAMPLLMKIAHNWLYPQNKVSQR
jgi:antibiotic biosynthesis monooxygenase (ABM) superfamily enzyme